MTLREGTTRTHHLSKVLSRPSKKARAAVMHMLQWLDRNRLRGNMFRYAGNAILEVSVDASNTQDQRGDQVAFGYQARLGDGPTIAEVAKLKNSGMGTPAVKFMALATCVSHMELPSVSAEQDIDAALLSGRWAAASTDWVRQLLAEIGVGVCCVGPTRVQSDNTGAIE